MIIKYKCRICAKEKEEKAKKNQLTLKAPPIYCVPCKELMKITVE